MNNEYVAYEGERYTIEWFYDAHSKSQAHEYYYALTSKERRQVLKLFERMCRSGEIQDRTKFNYEGHQIYAFKPKPERFLCFFFDGKKIIVTNAFRKKRDKLPPEQKEKALRNKKSYETRLNTGVYYE